MSYYRIHSGDEPLENLLNVDRKDGWVASDEEPETQPRGISCCSSISDLLRYARYYSMNVSEGDVLVELEGSYSDDDRDQYAHRVEVMSYRVVGSAKSFARLLDRGVDADRVESLLWTWS